VSEHIGRRHLSRRAFLQRLGIGGVVVASSASPSIWGAGSAPAATRRSTPSGDVPDRTLVVVELGGGNDGLNTVVPIGVGAYHDLRPTLAVTEPIALTDEIGLHPSLPKLAARYAAGEVAVVEGLGYPDPDLSHFGSSAIWWSARGGAGTAGWLGAYLDETVGFDDPLAAVGIAPTPPPALLGRASFATTIADASGLTPRLPRWLGDPATLLEAWQESTPRRAGASTLTGQVARAIDLTVEARTKVAATLEGAELPAVDDDTAPTRRRAYQDRSVETSLALAAALIRSSTRAPRVVYVSGIGDYDTHQGQADQHPQLLGQLDAGVDAFFEGLGERADRTVLMTTSEFGRRPTENGSGTDHGTANTHLVVGPPVRGGRYGEPPSLQRLDRNGNLVHKADFRSLYTTVLDGWLQVDAAAILGDEHERFDLFRPGDEE
jgi:uncharacterized protein (DUF1501 family)